MSIDPKAIEFTKTTTADVYRDPCPGMDDAAEFFHDCERCGGRGIMPEYRGIDGGICYECNGAKGHTWTVAEERKLAKDRARREAGRRNKEAKRIALHDARLAEAVAAFPALAGWHDEMAENAFLSDLWSKMFERDLTAKQIEAAARVFERKAARAAAAAAEEAAKVPAPEGKHTVTGTVVATKWQDPYNGYGAGTPKMLVALEGWKAWATVPSAILDGMLLMDLRGAEVTFTATFERSAGDESFAIAKRPTKVTVTPAAA
jgi:hypothetical protein